MKIFSRKIGERMSQNNWLGGMDNTSIIFKHL